VAARVVSSCCVFAIIILAAGCGSQASLPITLAVTPQATAIAAGQTIFFSAGTDNRSITWSATQGAIDAAGNYTAPTGASTRVTVTATSKTDPTVSASATVNVVATGEVSPTANPQVASYSIAPAAAAKVTVQFGSSSGLGLATWTRPVPPGGGTVTLLVAGMKANSVYHMQAVARFDDGTQFVDADHTFTTGSLPAGQAPLLTATTTNGMKPQGGVELLDMVDITSPAAATVVSDLSGNVLWAYNSGLAGVVPNPIKLLPNGHFLINFSSAGADGAGSVLQEVDLTGAVIWQMTAADLNAALAAATCAGCNITVVGTHHDFAVLPNGHLIVIAAVQQDISGTTVTGDALIDLDQDHKPVWLWNEFDHLDVDRQPMNFPDWTHTNAVLYSPDDGSLIVSIRHQNWLVKVDYANGAGAGDILWRLGYQGDFTLAGGTDPTDWFYAQHGPSFVTTSTAGSFSLALFDNGNDRVFPSGVTCGTAGAPPCFYSTVPIFQLDESAKTAALTFHPTTPTFSNFGGNAEQLMNGDVEYCEAAGGPGFAGDIYEVTPGNQVVWQMQSSGQFIYRGQRLPSLYPGVQW
jgi:arylsulfate sulfotransferase